MKIFTLILSLLLFQLNAFAQKKYQISGQVTDSVSGKGIAKVVVTIAGTSFRDTTNFDGFFRISNVPVGKCNLNILQQGYLSYIKALDIKKDARLNIALIPEKTAPAPKDTVVVSTPAEEKTRDTLSDKAPVKEEKPALPDQKMFEELILDLIDFKEIYFVKTRHGKKDSYCEGFFTAEGNRIFSFSAKFSRSGNILLLRDLSFKLMREDEK